MSFPAYFFAGVLGGIAVFVATTKTRKPRRRSRRVALSLLWFWAVGVVYFAFGTTSGGGRHINVQPLDVSNEADVVDAALNVLMFLPGGVLLAMLPLRWYQAMLVGFLGSLAIEITQFLTDSGRSADVNDLISNVLGTVIGVASTAAVLALVRRRRGTGSRTPAGHR